MKEESKSKETQQRTDNQIPNLNANLDPNLLHNLNSNFQFNLNPNSIPNLNQFYPMLMSPFNPPNNSINKEKRCECGELIPNKEKGKPPIESCPKCGKQLVKKEGILNKILKLLKIMISMQIINAYNLNQYLSGFYMPIYPPYPLYPPYPSYPPYPPYIPPQIPFQNGFQHSMYINTPGGYYNPYQRPFYGPYSPQFFGSEEQINEPSFYDIDN